MARRRPNSQGEEPSQVQYPAHWEADVALRDGTTAHLRPITPQYATALQRFHRLQSPQSVYFRSFAPMAEVSPRVLAHFTHVDCVHRVAVSVSRREEIIGVGRVDRLDGWRTAELAFIVSDAHLGQGFG